MKIAILSLWAQKLFDESETAQFGGAELQLYLLANFLATECAVEVRFITRGRGPFKRFTTESGIEVWKLPYRKTSAARTIFGLWDIYKSCLDVDADVYIQRGGGVETGVTAFAAKQKGRPFVFMCSSIWDADRMNEKNRGFLLGMFYMFGLSNAATVVTQTLDQQNLLKENYGRESLVLRSAHVIPEPTPMPAGDVLWVGRCDETKRPDRFLDLAESMPQNAFTMVCPLIHPNSNSRQMFIDIQERASAIANVTFFPGVSFGETEQLFNQHRVSVNTSDKEGYPNTFVQSFKWGRPVASLNVDPDAILTEKQLGGCANGDWRQFVEITSNLLNNVDEWRKLSNNARRFAEEQHDIQRIGRRLYEHIQDLL